MKSALPGVLRAIAGLILFGGIALGGLDAYGAAKMEGPPDQSIAQRLPALSQAVAIVLGLGGIAIGLWAAAAILEQAELSAPSQDPSPAAGHAGGDGELRAEIEKLRQAFEQSRSTKNETDENSSAGWAGPANDSPTLLRQMLGMLEEVRELVHLNDSQRQERFAEAQRHRRNFLASDVQTMLDRGDWSAAEKSLADLEGEYPGDNVLVDLRRQLSAGRGENEQKTLIETRERVEDLMAVSSWDQAFAQASRFVSNFPGNVEGKQLLDRVTLEREAYVETTSNRLYEEIKSDIARRHWRRALAGATRLLERSPGHRRSAMIRPQLKTIQQNAEIEERQEQERTIQELIRAKRFPEAIDRAEVLLETFPNSPQAESLQKLLPKMKELAIGSEMASEE
jgi:outer membrane protein assembly factor BamD (BamD/ComL family)